MQVKHPMANRVRWPGAAGRRVGRAAEHAWIDVAGNDWHGGDGKSFPPPRCHGRAACAAACVKCVYCPDAPHFDALLGRHNAFRRC